MLLYLRRIKANIHSETSILMDAILSFLILEPERGPMLLGKLNEYVSYRISNNSLNLIINIKFINTVFELNLNIKHLVDIMKDYEFI
jgi:hypothetical protein